MALATVGLLWKSKTLPEPAIVAGAALIGLVAYPLLHSQSQGGALCAMN
jgi:chromate transporter